MAKGYLIDSNPIIDFFNNSLPKGGVDLISDIEPVISIITQIEIFSKKGLLDREISELKDFLKIATIYDVNQAIAVKIIDIKVNYNIKLPDAIIAATALHFDLKLITRNTSDFNKIKGLEVIDPHII